MLNCKVCFGILQDPINFPRDETYSDKLNKAKCMFCDKTRPLTDEGFPANKFCQDMLSLQLNALNIDLDQFNECKKLVRDSISIFSEFESI